MRRTLSFVFVTAIVVLTVVPAQASWLSEMLFGRHREYTAAGITYAVDEMIPAAWVKDEALSVRYWKEGAPVFAGTVLRIGVLLTTGSEDGRRFAVCVTDPDMVVGNFSGEADFRSDLNRDRNGGLRVLGTFVGKYGLCELNTAGMEPGTYFLYTYAIQSRKSWKFSEEAIAIQIAPSLDRIAPALQDEPEDVLKQWGLESYPTLQDVVGRADSVPATFDVLFADGGRMSDVRLAGRPGVGRYLGVFTEDTLVGVVRIESIKGGTVRTRSSSRFLAGLGGREDDLKVVWVVKTEVYSTKGARRMTAEQSRNLATFPDGPVGSSTFGLRNMVYEMFQADIVHLNAPFSQNTSLDYQQMYQNWTAAKHTWIVAPQEAYVPCAKAREVRCVRLSPCGIPVVKIEAAKVTSVDSHGIFGGIAYIIGQAVRRPDRTNVSVSSSANAPTKITNTNTLSQQQQQQQQQQQDVAVDP